MSKTVFMRGLQVFVSDVRACQNKEQESARVEKELAKIRGKFNEDRVLSGYDRRKYVWKLLYIYMLGYDIDFGHKQACDLIPATKYSDKQVGYMACSLLLDEKDEFLRLSINAIRLDLVSRNEAFQCLALGFVSNVGGQEMAEALAQDVMKLLASGATRSLVKKKAALCLLKLMRKGPPDAPLVVADIFAPTMATLLEERDLGATLSAVTLLLGIVTRNGSAGYESCQQRLLRILERLVVARDVPPDYTYYGLPSPWLQCKVLRALQFFPAPENANEKRMLLEVLQTSISVNSDAAKVPNTNKANAMYGVLFEVVALCLHLDIDRPLLASSVATLGKFMISKEPNTRYLTLENLARLALIPEILEVIKLHQISVIGSLRDPDISIRRRAMDLLFTICDASNAGELVGELVKYLVVADFSMREELVLKVAILAEKFAPSVQWYVDIVLQLLESAGDFVGTEIWHRVVQLITNNEPMQQYAAHNIVQVLKRGAAHESLVSTAAYVLGEYGRLIRSETSPSELFHLLLDKWPLVAAPTRALLMTAALKLLLQDPTNTALKADVVAFLSKQQRSMDADLQQRATEYLVLASRPGPAVLACLQPMPRWPERESMLLRRLQKQEGVMTVDGEAAAPMPTAGSAAAAAAAAAAETPATSSVLVAQASTTTPSAASVSALAAGPSTIPPSSQDLKSLVSFESQPGTPAHGSANAALAAAAATKVTAQASVPVAAAAAGGQPGAMDLLDLLAPTPAPVRPPPPVVPDPFAASTDLPVAAHEEVRLFGDLHQWYMQLLVKERGILYEDTYIQIGIQSRYNRGTGDMKLFVGNKHPDQPISRLICVVPATPALQFAVGPIPPHLMPKQQLQIGIQILCLQPFMEPPLLQIGYTLNGTQVNQELKLPIANHKFLVPQPQIAKEVFFECWRTYDAAPYKLQEMLDRQTVLSQDSAVSTLRTVNFGVEHGHLDPSPHNEAGAALFCCGMPETQMLCQVRLEGNPATRMQFRLTVATPHPMLSTTLKELLVHQVKTSM